MRSGPKTKTFSLGYRCGTLNSEKEVMDLLPNKRLTVLLDQLELKNEKVRKLCFENGTNKEKRYRRDITFFMQGCVKK